MEFRVLGPLEVVRAGRALDLGGLRQRAVLAALLVSANSVVSVDRLVDDLWGATPPRAAIGSLHAYVSNLRKILEPHRRPRTPATTLVTQPPGYLLRVEPGSFDAERLEDLTAGGSASLAAGDAASARSQFGEALGLWRGPALADFAYEPFTQPMIRRLDELRLLAEEGSLAASLELGDHALALSRLEELVHAHPLHERFWELYAIALYRSGRQVEALREVTRARHLLREELGLDPSPMLRDVERRILDHDAELQPSVIMPSAPPSSGSTSSRPPRSVVLGRRTALRELETMLVDAAAGRGGLCLIEGEPGAGKTHLVSAMAEAAEARGSTVVWGHCDDVRGRVLEPWRQVLRALGRSAPLHEGWPSDHLEAQAAEFRLQEEVIGALGVAARATPPLVVVVEDVHAADAATLALLAAASRHLAREPLLVVVTRRVDDSDGTPVAQDLATLARLARSIVSLGPLSTEDVRELARLESSAEVPDAIADVVHRRSGGNALFAVELIRLVVAAGSRSPGTTEIPPKVRDVIAARLARLPEATRSVLQVAAVVGERFAPEVVANAAAADVDHVIEHLEPAVVTRTVVDDPTDPGRASFAHALVRDAIYAAIDPLRRARLHRRVAEAIEAMWPDDPSRAADAAHHWLGATLAGNAAPAFDAAVRAARAAASTHSFEEAAQWLERALEVHRHIVGRSLPREADLLIELTRVRWLAGDLLASHAAAARALDICEQLGDDARAACVATQYGGYAPLQWRPFRTYDLRRIRALERSVGRLADDDRALRVINRACLAIELYYVPGRAQESLDHARAAVADAAQLGEPPVLARALHALVLAAWRPEHLGEQREAAERLASLDDDAVPVAARLTGRIVAASARLTSGDGTTFEQDTERAYAEALSEHQPTLLVPLALNRAMIAISRDDVDEARRRIEDASSLFERLRYWGAAESLLVQRVALHEQAGTLGDLYDTLAATAGKSPHPLARLVTGLAALDRGDRRAAIVALQAEGGVPEPTWSSLFQLSVLAQLAAGVRDRSIRTYYDALAPYADRVVMLGYGVVCRGSAHYFLGELAAAAEDDRASAHFERAADINRRLGLLPWATRAEQRLATI